MDLTDEAGRPPAGAQESARVDPEAASPSAQLLALDDRLSEHPFDPEGQRARFVGFIELEMYDEAFKRLHAYLYLQLQRGQLPSESTWTSLLDSHFDLEYRAAEGTTFLSLLDDFYHHSPTIDALLLDYVLAEGRVDVAAELLDRYILKYPDDPKWQEWLDELNS